MDERRRKFLIGGGVLGGIMVAGGLPATCAWQQIRKKSTVPTNSAPRRPAGTAKPLIEEDIAPVLARLDAWYAAHLRPDKYRFNAPATDAALDAFERLVGIAMPNSFRQLYRWHDGEEDDRWGHIYGLPILPLAQAGYQWTAWNRAMNSFDGNRYMIPGAGWPRGAVDPAYINPRWIPLTHDGSGNHIGLDFDAWPGGRQGQVILYGRDEDVKLVLAPSLGKFLEWIAGLLEGGNFRLEAGPEEVVLRQFRLKAPSAIGFHDGARIILNAPGPFL